MSEEEDLHFERSQIGHDANDLHTHGGLDEEAHEDKTDRESLEEAIEALDDSNDIEEVKESTEEPVEEEKSEPVEEEGDDREAIVASTNDWKTKEENQPYMTVDEVVEPKAKKKGGLGWKIATFLFLLIAIAGCGAAAFLFFNNGKTEFLGRTVESYPKDKKPGQTQQQPAKPEFQFDEAKIDYSALLALMPEGSIFSPIKIDYTKDGKYYFVVADVFQGETGYAGTWYRAVEKDSEWTELQSGQAIPSCSEMTENQLKMIEKYGDFDDDLESQYIGCSDETIDAEGGEETPAE